MAAGRVRLDDLLVSRGVYPDRDAALRAVMAGEVRLDGHPVSSAALKVSSDVSLDAARPARFVSRGGEKIARALEVFAVDPTGWSCVDCGASTGGFTDCLLQHGAARVLAVDVGYGQFAWKLRCDPRVTLMERTNIRDLDPATCGAPFDLAVADVSFAPLHTYLPSITRLLAPGRSFITLVKPQFEAPKALVGQRGVVADPQVHADTLGRAVDAFRAAGFGVTGLTFSPIKGPMGNIEYLLMGCLGGADHPVDVSATVAASHRDLDGGEGDPPSLRERRDTGSRDDGEACAGGIGDAGGEAPGSSGV